MGKSTFIKTVVSITIACYYFLGFFLLQGAPLLYNRDSSLLYIAAEGYGLLIVCLNTLLLVGVVKKSITCLECYLVLCNVILLVATIDFIIILKLKVHLYDYYNDDTLFVIKISLGVTILISWLSYFYTCLYYKNMKKENRVASNIQTDFSKIY